MNFDDHYAIRELINGYAECSDRGDFDGIGALYANCVLRLPNETIDVKVLGVDGFMKRYNRHDPKI